MFAAFDIAEVAHRQSDSTTALVAIAAAVALLHVVTVGLSAAAFRAPERA